MDAQRIYSPGFTDAGTAVEVSVAADFDDVLSGLARWFTVTSEVTGWYVSQRCRVPAKQPRIDRILLPTRELRNAHGWSLGPVGVELKRESEKIGPAVCQCLDYSHAVLPVTGGLTCMLEWVFIWPVSSVTGDLASVMVQNRIGWASAYRDRLTLKCGGTNILTADPGEAKFKKPVAGYKQGSR